MPADGARRLALLGSTGSIGVNVLDVVASLPGRFEVLALAAGENLDVLVEQVARFAPRLVSVRRPEMLAVLRARLEERRVAPLPELVSGDAGLAQVAAATDAARGDLLVAATVGIAGLEAVYDAVTRGVSVALANKETLVVAGELILAAAARSGAELLPIDSEHSAIHQCLRAGHRAELARIVLTASGGPFRNFTSEQMARVSVEQALQHPTWRMGGRITIDSATLINKGFEVLEACHLFGLGEEHVDVLVHPQSIVHSLVEFRDGSVLAQLGTVDMRTPIQYALTYPERCESARPRLNLAEIGRLDFEPPDTKKFPLLGLARHAWRAGGTAPALLNAADEVAVAAFLARQIPFSRIASLVDRVLSTVAVEPIASLETVKAADARARQQAEELIAATSRG